MLVSRDSFRMVHAEINGPKGMGLAELTNLPAGRQGIAKAIEVRKVSICVNLSISALICVH